MKKQIKNSYQKQNCNNPIGSGVSKLKLLSRKEVELEYGITARFLELAAWRGDGPTQVKLGHRTIRYRRGDIEAFIAKKTVVEAKDVS